MSNSDDKTNKDKIKILRKNILMLRYKIKQLEKMILDLKSVNFEMLFNDE
jgi:hypothetical protein